MDFIEPCFGIGHNLSLICQMTSEDIKHQLIIIIFPPLSLSLFLLPPPPSYLDTVRAFLGWQNCVLRTKWSCQTTERTKRSRRTLGLSRETAAVVTESKQTSVHPNLWFGFLVRVRFFGLRHFIPTPFVTGHRPKTKLWLDWTPPPPPPPTPDHLLSESVRKRFTHCTQCMFTTSVDVRW